MGAWLFLDKDAVRSTCATKGEVLKFILWVSPTGGGAHTGTATRCVTPIDYCNSESVWPLLSHNVLLC